MIFKLCFSIPTTQARQIQGSGLAGVLSIGAESGSAGMSASSSSSPDTHPHQWPQPQRDPPPPHYPAHYDAPVFVEQIMEAHGPEPKPVPHLSTD